MRCPRRRVVSVLFRNVENALPPTRGTAKEPGHRRQLIGWVVGSNLDGTAPPSGRDSEIVLSSAILALTVIVLSVKGDFYLPGGGQEDGEIAEAAATREALEECGARIRMVGRI